MSAMGGLGLITKYFLFSCLHPSATVGSWDSSDIQCAYDSNSCRAGAQVRNMVLCQWLNCWSVCLICRTLWVQILPEAALVGKDGVVFRCSCSALPYLND